TGLDVRTVGDMGELPSTLPVFLFPDVPLNLETLFIILPYAIPLCIVGLLESLMTATLIDDITDTPSNKNRECQGQGIANIVTGLFGGMAGCAVIGQSMINMRSGGRGRLSTFSSGGFLLILIMLMGDWVAQIPMAALIAVMIMVSIGTFEWSSIWNIRNLPITSTIVMVVTVSVVLYTHNLAWGVGAGVLLSSLFFAHKVARYMRVSSTLDQENEHRTYQIEGQLFFVSANAFAESFDFQEVLQKVTLDVSRAHFWDLSAIGALDKVVLRFRRDGAEVEVVGLNDASANLVGRLAVHDKPESLNLPTEN
ncbi:MAG TPA: SulP family inorganic anion transporter, partial [Opitutales bacterium]|nr:SulP family inorganic anion transporter [Opitutales bacterium]